MKTSNIVAIVILAVIYTFLLGVFGCFGETLSSAFRYFLVNILPYIGMVFGYFLVIFIPIRVSQALTKNKERDEEMKKDTLLQEYSAKQKQDAERVRQLLSKEDEI